MIRKLTKTVLVLAAVCGEPALAHPPWGISIDDRGRVYFADIDHGNHVWRIDASGTLSSVISGRHSHDLRLDHDQNLYLADLVYIPEATRSESRLLKLAPSGETSVVIPTTTDRRRFWAGGAFALDREGGIYFGYTSDSRAGETEGESLLLKRSPGGRVAVVAGGTSGSRDGIGNGAQFTVVRAPAWGPGGVLYVSDEFAIRTVARDGSVSTLARGLVRKQPGSSDHATGHLFGLAVDDLGMVFAADHDGRRIVRVTTDGQATTASESERGWAPTGVAVSGGDLYILEVGAGRPGGPRVRKVSPGGKSVVLATVSG